MMFYFTKSRSGILFCIVGSMFALCAIAAKESDVGAERNRRIVIATKRLFDGRGRVLPETRIVVEGSKIVKLDPKAAPIDALL